MPDAPPSPPFTVLTLSLKCIKSQSKNHNDEIIMASAVLNKEVPVDAPNDKPAFEAFSAIRRLPQTPFPSDFLQLAKRSPQHIELCGSEHALLAFLMSKIQRADPDVIVGHAINNIDLEILLKRMDALKTPHYSRLGRLRRGKMPDIKGNRIEYAKRQVMAGRLLCDTWMSSKEMLLKEKNYTLANLAQRHLQVECHELESCDYPAHYTHGPKLISLVEHTTKNAWAASMLMHKLQVLPLTKQLTCLAGNLWQKSLFSQRAERIEYLLLHEFHRLKYVVPDKASFNEQKQKAQAAAEQNGDAPESGNWKKRKKAAYAGGLVLEPKRGFYDKCVLLLDFNSLYPSIIQEYNIDFTTVTYDKTKTFGANTEEGAQIPEVPPSNLEQGVLPRLIKTLVERRRAVKAELKKASDPMKHKQLDIRQMALKIMANSMYGCLGFTYSRFYAKPLAALVTLKGREILQDTMDLSNDQLGYEVIYGDTDSIMVYTAKDNLDEVRKIGSEIKREVNKKYKLLEIEIDGIMQSMLLLNKKKYAALMVEEKDGKQITVKETKGLDLVRRDWCELSQDVGNFVLDRILSGLDKETVVQDIHEYLQQVAEEIRGNKIPLRKYIINKCLTKPPEAYPEKGGLPHVHVALTMKARGDTVPVGTHIQYVITKGDEPSYSKRAKHPDQIERAEGMITVDTEWYLSQQIHPPISRLLNPIDGTDSGRIAECLGLDASKFRHEVTKEEEDDATPNVVLEDAERFRDCTPFEVACPTCLAAVRPGEQEWVDKLKCSTCKQKIPVTSMENALSLAIRSAVSRFNEGWLVCEESTCPQRTRQISLAQKRGKGGDEVGRQCLSVGCRGYMEKEYTDKQLYTQLVYLQSIFDFQRLDKLTERKLRGKDRLDRMERIEDKIMATRSQLQHLTQHVHEHLSQNAFNMINLADIFSNIIGRP